MNVWKERLLLHATATAQTRRVARSVALLTHHLLLLSMLRRDLAAEAPGVATPSLSLADMAMPPSRSALLPPFSLLLVLLSLRTTMGVMTG